MSTFTFGEMLTMSVAVVASLSLFLGVWLGRVFERAAFRRAWQLRHRREMNGFLPPSILGVAQAVGGKVTPSALTWAAYPLSGANLLGGRRL